MIKETLDQLWLTKKAKDAVFEMRAQAENALKVIAETVGRINEIVAKDSWEDVDSRIKAEGQAIIQVLSQVKNDLESNHGSFVSWRQPAKKAIDHSV